MPQYRRGETDPADTMNQILIKRFHQNYFKSHKIPIADPKSQNNFDLMPSAAEQQYLYTDRGN